ncbi:uncharacterized protein PADG_07990 [Paracoccidioides brasiliensis Pb18]|uniref:Uncharacterized protein n=1 Tax=Paracoccidioides brasiliensis (strain Pb18) TaxID=502780 RepID=C1GKY3_PARBD|nr:uncharacterized protein PADG_07990 [Paracoccidioides brasiliensis Pb18]EEH43170.2 hypothetical protein PADG_07990 [Paracoccidioides brasiliensis Pb18]
MLDFSLDDIEWTGSMVPMKLLMLFMHVRSDAASVTGTTCFRNILEHTKPGGLLEIQEPEAWMRSEVDTMSNETGLLIDAGFVDVHEEAIKAEPLSAPSSHSALQNKPEL